MVDQVEVDLKRARAVGDRRGRETARGDIQRDVPGMIEPWCPCEADLADDLGPQMQRVIGAAPGGGGQFRPGILRRFAHLSPPSTALHRYPRHDKAGRDPPGLYRATMGVSGWRLSRTFSHPWRTPRRLRLS